MPFIYKLFRFVFALAYISTLSRINQVFARRISLVSKMSSFPITADQHKISSPIGFIGVGIMGKGAKSSDEYINDCLSLRETCITKNEMK